jgi:hypothetical protein
VTRPPPPAGTEIDVELSDDEAVIHRVVEFAIKSALLHCAQWLDMLRSCPLPFTSSELTLVEDIAAFLMSIRGLSSAPDIREDWAALWGSVLTTLFFPRAVLHYTRQRRVDELTFKSLVGSLEACTRMEELLTQTVFQAPARQTKLLLKAIHGNLFANLLQSTEYSPPDYMPLLPAPRQLSQSCDDFVHHALGRMVSLYFPALFASHANSSTSALSLTQLRFDKACLEMRSQLRLLTSNRHLAESIAHVWSMLVYEGMSYLLRSSAALPTVYVTSMLAFETAITTLIDVMFVRPELFLASFQHGATQAWMDLTSAEYVAACNNLSLFCDQQLDSVRRQGTLVAVASSSGSPSQGMGSAFFIDWASVLTLLQGVPPQRIVTSRRVGSFMPLPTTYGVGVWVGERERERERMRGESYAVCVCVDWRARGGMGDRRCGIECVYV